MPELPEVETSRVGIAPHIEQKNFQSIIIRQAHLRWPVPTILSTKLPDLKLESVARRGKYLLLITAAGTLILHLGMSGKLRITCKEDMPGKHDHVDFIFADGTVLRFNDQRKFGAILWTSEPVFQHALLVNLGPEPLSDQFNGDYLHAQGSHRSIAIKTLLMNSHIVVGVGNIYANEALFMAGIHPIRQAGKISRAEYCRLVDAVKKVLQAAIRQGGTTLKDFSNAEGKPGYFQQSLNVYGRAGQACVHCSSTVNIIKINQRSSYFCSVCQH